jgi:hypothetical protein
MIITKDDIIKLMKKTIHKMWLTDEAIDWYENAISLISGELLDKRYTIEQREEDLNKILAHIVEYDDFKIENIYDILKKHKPWNFMMEE